MTGKVDCTGGIVAKSVGPTGTTVVAVPVTSTPQEVSAIAVATKQINTVFDL